MEIARQIRLRDLGGHQARDIASELGYLFYSTRVDKLILEGAHHAYDVDIWGEVSPHKRHLELHLEVESGPQPSDDELDPCVASEIHSQPGKGLYPDVGDVFHRLRK